MVNTTVLAARQAAKEAYETFHYDGLATVAEWRKTKNATTKLTEHGEVTVYSDQPCHLSIEGKAADDQSASAASITQTTKLFISPDLTIKPGSKITVTQAGVTTVYTHSGKSAVYDTHQEIVLDLFEKWA